MMPLQSLGREARETEALWIDRAADVVPEEADSGAA
jgi:hypothetical protein